MAATGKPMVLHGGTGLTDIEFADLIARGCAKVNISTAVKLSYMAASLSFLRQSEEKNSWDPLALFSHTRAAVRETAAEHLQMFRSGARR